MQAELQLCNQHNQSTSSRANLHFLYWFKSECVSQALPCFVPASFFLPENLLPSLNPQKTLLP